MTIISVLAILVGAGGLMAHAAKFDPAYPWGTIAICVLSLIAVVAGIFMLGGRNWARWLWLAWMAFHVAISFFNALSQVLVHAAMFAVFAFLLFRPSPSAYFQGAVAGPASTPNPDDAENKSETQ